MFRTVTVALLLAIFGTAQADEPCTTATNGYTTWAWCASTSTCYVVEDGALVDVTVDNSEDDCHDNADDEETQDIGAYDPSMSTRYEVSELMHDAGLSLSIVEVAPVYDREVRR